MHASLVYGYLRECGYKTQRCVTRKVASEIGKQEGGNVGWVLREFAKELKACRQRKAVHADTLLIVMIDADRLTVDERRGELKADPEIADGDPLAVLIPRRHVETWIRAAVGCSVSETENCKKPEPRRSDVRAAAATIHKWARENPPAGENCVPSLRSALPEWRKIG